MPSTQNGTIISLTERADQEIRDFSISFWSNFQPCDIIFSESTVNLPFHKMISKRPPVYT